MADLHDMYYGEPGSGKTDAIIRRIVEMHRTTGKLARVYIGDGSKRSYKPLVEKGIVALMDFSYLHYPMSATQLICEGHWPIEPENELTHWRKLTPKEVADTGMWVLEGASVMGNYIMGNVYGGLAWQSAQGIKLGQESPIKIVDSEPTKITDSNVTYKPDTGTGLKFGGNPQSHYNIAQKHMQGLFMRTKRLPGVVVWTAHERETEEQGAKIVGPEVAGRALTATLPKDFNNTLHFTIALRSVQAKQDDVTKKNVNQVSQQYRIYTRDHFDPDGMMPGLRFKAINRAADATLMPDYLTGPQGEAIAKFYELLDTADASFLNKMFN